ncbi:carbohydrate kinase [Sphingobacterium olei]|uniref:Carbohydrate kinase n=1 Tax=Sphingobacterium olei TaxID=2571155 RepID=A0A4U0P692_9SPHI|nr:FGGY-family carbohydrate kinase [Sphingobacterium olei]TJZ62945.1 carbohydrate kinase [Sphingobacterium olei]
MNRYFFGVDVGTQGIRVVLVDQNGHTVASGARHFFWGERFREEQSPEMWWQECSSIIGGIVNSLPKAVDKRAIMALSVTSTSGTVIPLDSKQKPLHPAIMYSDGRSVRQGKRCQKLALRYVADGYTGFNSSSGISKILWYMETYPEKVPEIALWVHASDYIIGRFCGNFSVTDYTNVLKSGYDLQTFQWPVYLIQELGFKKEWLQNVVPSGTVVGKLQPQLCAAWGLLPLDVVVGMTDGCATQMASGAVKPGDWNTTIGTTMVIKGVTRNNLIDPLGRLYSHRHPEGYWMPGGASNTGADWISIDFPTDLDALNTAAQRYIPTGKLAWPLKQQGERYPIMAPNAVGFAIDGLTKEVQYAANLEGVACIERLAYEIIEELSGEEVRAIYTAGGGSNSEIWLQIRASLMNVPIYKCKEASGALGAAIMAASYTFYSSLSEAATQMTTIDKTVVPQSELADKYEIQYQEFKQKLKDLNYL